jgi:hypothetical protein
VVQIGRLRKKKGRPKILPPADHCQNPYQAQDPNILHSIGHAWNWRCRMDGGEFAIIQELPEAVGLAERHVSRQLRLAYLAPEVPKQLACGNKVSIPQLVRSIFAGGGKLAGANGAGV